jgi:hypothetical protein
VPDLRRLREDFGYFDHALGDPMVDWQLDDLSLEAPITALLWARQLGKSRGLARRAVWRAFQAPERRILQVSGGGELGARRLLGEGRSVVTGSALLRGSVVDEGASVIRFSNGSEIRCVPASEAAIRGWVVDELHLDEAQLLSESLVFGAAMPTVSARPGARVVLAGTAGPASGPFYDLCRRGETGDEHVRFSRRVSRLVGGPDHAPWQVPSMIEAQVAAMSPLRADAEHRCVWASDADALFTRTALESALADYTMASLEDLRGPARLGVGIDWGHVHDRTVATALGRFAGTSPPVYGVVAQSRWPEAYPPLRSAEEIAASPGHFQYAVSEGNGLGAPLSDHLFAALSRRPPESGGGRRARAVIVEEGRGRTFPQPRSRPSAADT